MAPGWRSPTNGTVPACARGEIPLVTRPDRFRDRRGGTGNAGRHGCRPAAGSLALGRAGSLLACRSFVTRCRARARRGTVVTIGAYDGVHRGHAAVIGRVRRAAQERGMATAVVTFDRHPAWVVRPESAPLLLTDLDQKLELLAATGVDYTLVIHFDEVRSKEPAEDFVRDDLWAASTPG